MDESARSTCYTELIDPACVAETFSEGIGEIEKIGDSCIRLTMYATRSIGRGARERVVVSRLVMPIGAFSRGLRQCTAFLEGVPLLAEDVAPEGTPH